MNEAELLEIRIAMLRQQVDTAHLAKRLKRTRRTINYALAGKRKDVLRKIKRVLRID